MDHSRDMRSYMEALEEERRKIQVFHRELPLCMELVTQAIDACTKQLATKECKEFIPIRKVSTSSDHTDDEVVDADDDDELHSHSHSPSSIDDDGEKKSDWLRSVSLWNPNPDNIPLDHQVGTTATKSDASWSERAASPPGSATTSSAAGSGGVNRSDGLTTRKQRRCWSPELHRRFVHALQQLGGSHAATPKQIRDLMKVDGLTNDEVKSHLQKYRLHTRRPSPSAAVAAPSPQQPQFVVVGGIWAPPPPPRAAIHHHHHHVAASATSSRIAAANRRYVTLPFPAAPPQQIRRKGEASEETRTANPAEGSNSADDSSSTTHTISAC